MMANIEYFMRQAIQEMPRTTPAATHFSMHFRLKEF
jgi:hypothetical protein